MLRIANYCANGADNNKKDWRANMKKSKIILVFFLALILSSQYSSVFAVSDNYIYLKYTGSSFVVGTYAYSNDTSKIYDEMVIRSYLDNGSPSYESQVKYCYNTSTCSTTEITLPYYSSYSYTAESQHRGYINGGIQLYADIVKSL